ncbi:MAG: hypothetical protein A2015_14135 [Spirochaetes bacterium GWF1_31_7]|nr:MAG: hypothetical protein A2Y30_03615 [Spirochaetes bacterium GWE1_32_154]OHD45246.1 MAG: hypothetical protein A2Y29_02325 [Spirochaetes bacterium GWE2_31_10]OHD50541.1 MAG: hypothetical protein A2015_14135 [Spirochaetes bacterium GWF1_31_7]OHD79195.1 MAG: hypothetical protein A2355_09745 [Spirochaetes bacterium RIFOXYB1_FULL_32_8]HBD94191.1 hypothetical protein [Spirochaetia bacterium]
MILYFFISTTFVFSFLATWFILKHIRYLRTEKAFYQLEKGNTNFTLKNRNKTKLLKLERSYLIISNHFNSIMKNLNEFNETLSVYINQLKNKASVVDSNIKEQDSLISNFESSLSLQSASIESAANGLDDTRKLFKNILNNFTTLFNKIESLSTLNDTIQIQNNRMNSDAQKAILFTNNLKDVTGSGLSKIDNIITFIENLDTSVKKIDSMASIITQITAKTNLLSMNASIEAAHAGEAGKGFAVVASEIKKLSESSDKAAKSINTTINDIFSQMETGKETSNRAKDGINEITNEIDSAISIMNELSENTQKQITGTIDTKNIINEIHNLSKDIKESSIDQEKKVNEIYETTDIVNAQGFIINTLLETQKEKLIEFNKISNELVQVIQSSTKYSEYYKKIIDVFKHQS